MRGFLAMNRKLSCFFSCITISAVMLATAGSITAFSDDPFMPLYNSFTLDRSTELEEFASVDTPLFDIAELHLPAMQADDEPSCSITPAIQAIDSGIHETRKRTQPEKKSFTCKELKCNFTSRSVTAYNLHMNSHTGKKPFICEICGRGLTQEGNLKRHRLTHEEKKPFACTFPGCTSAFCQKGYRDEHYLKAHTEEKPYRCEKCPYGTVRERDLKTHMRSHEKPSTCTVPGCNTVFKKPSSLDYHLLKAHGIQSTKRQRSAAHDTSAAATATSSALMLLSTQVPADLSKASPASTL